MKNILKTTTLVFCCSYFLLTSCSNNNKKNVGSTEKDIMKESLVRWMSLKIKEGKYAPLDSCTSSYFNRHPVHNFLNEGLGFPDTSKFHYLYEDINNDKHLDALVTFHPVCCTCSDTTGKVMPQAQVILISNSKGFDVNDTFFYHLIADSLHEYLDVDSAASNSFYGTYFELGKQDTSVDQYQKSVVIAFDTREMKLIQRKRNKRME